MNRKNLYFIFLIATLLSCSERVQVSRTLEQTPELFPDYTEVVIPPNIAPLNFRLKGESGKCRAIFSAGEQRLEVQGKAGGIVIPEAGWKALLQSAVGRTITVTVQVEKGKEWVEYAPFSIQVAPETIDAYLVYRLIDPGYELWDRMGIYQRNVETYAQSAIIENKMTGSNCINCHAFCQQDPEQFLLHMRANFSGTLLIQNGKAEKLNTQTPQTISPLVYPAWHPSGRYVAFSVNTTKQAFHLHDKNRIEVYDEASDVVVYDVEKREIITAPQLFAKEAFETFPTFSPDGKTLYFCTAEARPIPKEYDQIHYHLCALAFDPATHTFGQQVDTLYNAHEQGGSVSFPRVSPDGRYLLYTVSGYGNFSIWHTDADLHWMDLSTGVSRPLEEVNSDNVESYHSWSSNSRWFVFSSRRVDGLYTHPFIAYVSPEGQVGKPFLLPQKTTDFYLTFMKSFNVPEFVTGKVQISGRKLALKAQGKAEPVSFR